ncbi:hypothetical protein [uncultured Fusobacterium sp.]|uniref:hypothetical protein n=1 Tax=uncultured Fusobacterium sp. TaxID=159267 RepID=UPI0015A4FBC7|nr:hypothetical protein [uncultured Fusobacterium sp.]
MLEKNCLYQIQPLLLTIMDHISKKDVILNQDEIVKVLEFKGINVKIQREKTKEILEVSKQGLDFAVIKI